MSGRDATSGGGTTSELARACVVRRAERTDVDAVAAAVRELLAELDGTPSAPAAMRAAARTLIDSPWAGAVLVAEADAGTDAEAEAEAEIVGVLGASWQMAIHVPGSYALIQDLWVRPDWRDRAVGASLLEALFELARSRRFVRVEVGLPRESFARFGATEAFYVGNGFTANGPRMRRLLS
jgi:GNAT superfamily N-acetyltransferase